MPDLTAVTPDGEEITLLEEAVQGFGQSLRGGLILPFDPEYDDTRAVFNRMIDRRPAMIARCASTADVIRSVKFARAHDLLVAVRAAGHGVTGKSVCDGGLVIDLRPMKSARIDPMSSTVRAEPGLTWGELNDDLQEFGLGATGGYISITGIPGLTLGGGLGWLVRKHGLALDNLTSVDLVTAEGELLVASEEQNPDLFWGLRGGGGNFGVATSLEFKVHPVGTVLAGLLIHPIERAGDLLRLLREHVDTVPEELTWGVLLFTVPAEPPFPQQLHGVPVATVTICYAGPIEQGEEALRPIREFGPPLADVVQPMPFNIAQVAADVVWPPGFCQYWKSSYLTGLDNDAIETITRNFASVPSPKSVVVVDHNGGGAIDRVSDDETAFGHRGWTYNLLITSAWADPADSETNVEWSRSFWDEMEPFRADAIYVNYSSDEGEDLLTSAYSARTRERLVELKRKYDPTNFFRLNANIPV